MPDQGSEDRERVVRTLGCVYGSLALIVMGIIAWALTTAAWKSIDALGLPPSAQDVGGIKLALFLLATLVFDGLTIWMLARFAAGAFADLRGWLRSLRTPPQP